MKPIYGNNFLVTVNDAGECVVKIFHAYPETDAQGKPTNEVTSLEVASLVMTLDNAKALSKLLSDTVQKVEDSKPIASRAKGGVPN